MKKLLPVFLASAALSVCNAQYAVQPGELPVSLGEAYKLALAKSEALASGGEGIKQLGAVERQLKASLLPALNLNSGQTLADGQSGKAQTAVNLTYAVFYGMRDYIAVKSAALKTGAARLELIRARQALYRDVSLAYINLLSVRQEISARLAQLDVSDARIKELRDRARIGRTRESEVLAAKAQLAQDEAGLQDARSRESLAQFGLRFLTGLDGDLAPEQLELPEKHLITPYLAGAAKRFDVEAARKALEAARLDADLQKKIRWPSLNLGANYYLKRPAASQDSGWDAALALKMPLYYGGFVDASVDLALSRQAAAEFALRLAIRQAETEVGEAYSTLSHSISVFESLKKALQLAEENAGYQTKDYLLGLVTNLDVLNAQNTLLQTRLKLEQARAQISWSAIQLEVAGGGPSFAAEAK